jgi:hypothetical protein
VACGAVESRFRERALSSRIGATASLGPLDNFAGSREPRKPVAPVITVSLDGS